MSLTIMGSKRHHSPNSIKAFTLIELLISVSLMTGILMASYVCLQAALSARATVEDRSDAIQSARVIMDRLRSDLGAADRLSEEHGILGLNRDLEGIEADNIDFVTRHHVPKRPFEADYCEVSYFVAKNPETDRFVLLRRRDPLPDDKPLEGGQSEALIDHILGLKFEYYDGWDWFDDWGDAETPEQTTESEKASLIASAGRTGFPEAVRITLLIPDNDRAPVPIKKPTESGMPQTIPGAIAFQTIVHLNLAHADVNSNSEASNNGSNSGTNANPEP